MVKPIESILWGLVLLLATLVGTTDAFEAFPGVMNVTAEPLHVNSDGAPDRIRIKLDILGDWYGGIGFCDESTEGIIFTCYVPASAPDQAVCSQWLGHNFNVFPLQSPVLAIEDAAVVQTREGLLRTVTFTVDYEEATTHGRVPLSRKSNDTRVVVAYARFDTETNLPLTHTHEEQYSVLRFHATTGRMAFLENDGRHATIAAVICFLLCSLWLIAGVRFRRSMNFSQPQTRRRIQFMLLVSLVAMVAFYMAMNSKDYRAARKTIPFGRACGNGAAFVFSILLFPITKYVGIAPLVRMSTEKLIRYHVALGTVFIALVTIHGIAMIRLYSVAPDGLGWMHLLRLSGKERANGAGLLAWIVMVVMAIPAMFFRRRSFALFRYTHALFFVVVVLVVAHYPRILRILCMPLGLYILDVILRHLYGVSREAKLLSLDRLDDETTSESFLVVQLKVSVTPGTTFASPGQYVYLGCSEIGPLMHPFSVVSSASEEDGEGNTSATVVLIVKVMSPSAWTSQLADFAESAQPNPLRHKLAATAAKLKSKAAGVIQQLPISRLQSPVDEGTECIEIPANDAASPAQASEHAPNPSEGIAPFLHVSLTGPYGRLSFPVDLCSEVMLVAGGIGITPYVSFIRSFASGAVATGRLHLVWSVRSSKLLDIICVELAAALEPLAARARNAVPSGEVCVDIQLHRTSACEGTCDGLQLLRETLEVIRSASFASKSQLSIMNERPELNSIVNNFAVSAYPSRVGVFACGPDTMKAQVSTECGYHTENVYLHTETFNL